MSEIPCWIASCKSHNGALAEGGTMLLLYTSQHASKPRICFYDKPLSAQPKLLLSLESYASIHHRLRPRSRCTSIGYPSIVAVIPNQSTFPTFTPEKHTPLFMLSQILSVTVSYALLYPSVHVPLSEGCLRMALHLESECRRKNDTEEDVVSSEEEAKPRFPLAIDFLPYH